MLDVCGAVEEHDLQVMVRVEAVRIKCDHLLAMWSIGLAGSSLIPGTSFRQRALARGDFARSRARDGTQRQRAC